MPALVQLLVKFLMILSEMMADVFALCTMPRTNEELDARLCMEWSTDPPIVLNLQSMVALSGVWIPNILVPPVPFKPASMPPILLFRIFTLVVEPET